MASKVFNIQNYIDDGIIYTNHVFDGDGNHIRASRIWERWQHTRPTGAGRMDKIQSYDGGYVTNNIIDMQICGNKPMMLVTTAAGRRLYFALDSCIVTPSGPKRVRDLGVGTKLLTVDCYKYYWGDRLSLKSHGNARVRALLRNHEVPFVMDEHDGTRTEDWDLYCFNFDTKGPIVEDRRITYGLNNYREGIKRLFNLPDASTSDYVVSVKEGYKPKFAIAFYVDGPQNIVLDNGLIVQSTQTKVRE